MKRIGIIGGTTPESTMYYYRNFVEISRKRFEKNFYPEIVIFSLNFKKFRELPDWRKKKEYIMEGIRALENAGAEIIALSANTPHIIFPELQKESRVKMVSIIDAVAEEAKRRNLRKLLLLGTKITMTSEFYILGLINHGLEVLVPNSREIDEVDRVIFEELSFGNTKSKGYLVELIESYRGEIDAAILGCTELPIALHEGDTSVPLLDTARIHVNAIINEALKP
ncbi:aspartate racemase [Aciduliprofundum sp. MAR08-339]|uniref:aspartate/glutamate racemase family protein n=1 Tax=Aciduliprofundum sp. (strain MAR08-339) TaxID=673860 RepID=UPI0002A4B47A|nr:aspartate racemase [Aciduliprofundum sp. MAR08-339]